MLERDAKSFEGRSRDGRVSAWADHRMRLIELDFDPGQIVDPAYKGSTLPPP